MKKKNILCFIAALISCTAIFCSCGATSERSESSETAAVSETSAVTESESISDVDLTKGASSLFECADGWCNGSMFNVTWRKENCTFENGRMQLIIDKDKKDGSVPYSGAEYRSKDFYGYGRYEVRMKAIKMTVLFPLFSPIQDLQTIIPGTR